MPDPAPSIDPALVRGWLAARSLARGLPQPVADHGGWRVDTGLPTETCRHVFAHVCPGLRTLADRIDAPLVFLKLCAGRDLLRALLPPRWHVEPPNRMMVRDGPPGRPPPLPTGYRADLSMAGAVAQARIVAPDGDLAASGHAAGLDGVFVYDRIVTAEAHRRRGLGTVVMAMLGTARRSPDARQVLVATDAGAALYATLGWRVYAPYTTAGVPADQNARSPTTLPGGA